MRCLHLEAIFENLGEHDYDHNDVSPAVPTYNCIAWAADDDQQRWWPADWDTITYYWPLQLKREPFGQETLGNFIAAFESLGYKKCKSSKLEKGIEKVVIYGTQNHVPTHASRQLETGEWWSKCGIVNEDIKHKTFGAVEGVEYGEALQFLKRRRDKKPFWKDRIIAAVRKIFCAFFPMAVAASLTSFSRHLQNVRH